MQPTSREMQGMASRTLSPSSQISLQELQQQQLQQQQQQQMTNPAQIPVQNSSHFDHHQSTQDDFFDQMLSTLPASWADLSGNPKSPWDLNPQNPNNNPSPTATNSNNNEQKLFKTGEDQQQYPYDESTLLASRLRQHQISGNSPKSMMLQQQLLLSRGGGAPTSASDIIAFSAADPVFFPLRLGNSDASDSHLHERTVQGLFNSLTGSLPSPRNAQTVNQQHFHHPQTPNFSATVNGMTQVAVAGTSGGGGTVTAPVRQKVRARRGQATDPHSIAERLRRERIAERMKALQELVPNANKTDKASMLDEIIDYVKFLQLQVKVLSMSRLGGAGAVAPLVADISAEGGGGGDCIEGGGGANNGTNGAPGNDNSLTVTEHQVAKLMEEDMGSAMQYLQGKGLCLMPISLASAISTATACHSRNPGHPFDGPTSPNLSALTVQSATLANGNVEAPVKDPKS